MKKIIILLMALALSVGCSNTTAPESSNTATAPVIKSGMGIKGTMTSREAGEQAGALDTTVVTCGATFAEDGTILSVSWDTMEGKGAFDATGKLPNEIKPDILSKKEQGDAYGMKVASPIGKEWFEQIEALESYAVGKNVADVIATPVTASGAPDTEDLKSSCTISIGDFIETLNEAHATSK